MWKICPNYIIQYLEGYEYPLVAIETGPHAGVVFSFKLSNSNDRLDVDYKVLYNKGSSEDELDSVIRDIVIQILKESVT